MYVNCLKTVSRWPVNGTHDYFYYCCFTFKHIIQFIEVIIRARIEWESGLDP